MASIAKELKAKIHSFYLSHSLSLESPQLIGFSGGCDSVALLTLLVELSDDLMGHHNQFRVAYYNHNLRPQGELTDEISLIRHIADSLSVPLSLGKADRNEISGVAKGANRSLEEVARNYRYAFLEKEKKSHHCSYL